MQLCICELIGLRWHLIDFAIGDHGHNGVFAPTMQPDVVG